VLPRHLSADRLVSVTIACISRTPDLLACTRDSVLNSLMQAAQLGVEPTGVLGSAYLVPYNEQIKDEDDKGKKTGKWESRSASSSSATAA
jgi:recombination protein RecT